jgi:pyruvate/2-oxoglutarate dehydrogenase complex dihydrolipoamide acyltransferase (E2) component
MEIEAPCDGLLLSIAVAAGNDVNVGDTVCTIDNNPAAS